MKKLNVVSYEIKKSEANQNFKLCRKTLPLLVNSQTKQTVLNTVIHVFRKRWKVEHIFHEFLFLNIWPSRKKKKRKQK